MNKPVDKYNVKKQLLIEDSGEVPLTNVFFIIFQKYLVNGIAMDGIKG